MMSSAPMEERDATPRPALHCPRCLAACADGSRVCGECNYPFSSVSLFRPGEYPWLAIFFSFVVPALMAAHNWRRAGLPSFARRWLGISAVGFVSLAALAALVPRIDLGGTLLFAYLLNLPIGYHLYRVQQPLFDRFRSAGARTISPLGGVTLGLAALLAYAIVLGLTSALLVRIGS